MGLSYTHGYTAGITITEQMIMAGGVAAGDYDRDGLVDLYAVRGSIGPNLLLRNLGDGRFEDRAAEAGVGFSGDLGCGPAFADIDGDGWLDLWIGGVDETRPRMLRNRGDGRFEDMTARAGVTSTRNTVSANFGDYDRDGWPDLYVTHWGTDFELDTLWKGLGGGRFRNVDEAVGIGRKVFGAYDSNLSASFADFDDDGWPDLLIASDFLTSRVLRNSEGGARFVNLTTEEISDESGMGNAVGDYDNDGDLDWFVTSIWDPIKGDSNWGETGNRLYRNEGYGRFVDVTEGSGLREGDWGWATCFADFDNDGWLDLFHVNGMSVHTGAPFPEKFDQWMDNPSRLFLSNGDGSFSERGVELGVADTDQGRGVVCFDLERDGDIDLFVANNQKPPRLYINEGGNRAGHYLAVELRGQPPNTEALGARIIIRAGGLTQMRELRAGSNYVSQDPVEAHFGLGAAERVDRLRVLWPSGETLELEDIEADQRIILEE